MTRGPRRARPLRYELAVVLAVKVVALLALYAAFFSSVPPLPGVAEHLFNDGAAHSPESSRARE